jgi:hypothetical protein
MNIRELKLTIANLPDEAVVRVRLFKPRIDGAHGMSHFEEMELSEANDVGNTLILKVYS